MKKSLFDYPYFDVKEHNKLTDNAVRERYISDINLYEITLTQDDENKIIIANVDKAPTSDMVIYQQEANNCGEAVKYLYGMTEHQNFPSAITYYYNISSKGKENVYSYRLRIDEHYIEFLVDSYTGEICSVSTSGGLVIELDENAEEDRITEFLTDYVKSSLIAQANENLDVLEKALGASRLDEMVLRDNALIVEFLKAGDAKGTKLAMEAHLRHVIRILDFGENEVLAYL